MSHKLAAAALVGRTSFLLAAVAATAIAVATPARADHLATTYVYTAEGPSPSQMMSVTAVMFTQQATM